MEIIEILEKLKLSDMITIDDDGNTALHLAVESETLTHKEIVEILKTGVENGIDINSKNSDYKTVLQLTVAYRMKDAVEFLLACKANMDSVIHFFIENEFRRFKKFSKQISNVDEHINEIQKIENESANYTEWLILKGFDFDSKDMRAYSAVYLAIELNLQHILPVLFKYTNDIKFVDYQKRTLLHLFLEKNIKSIDEIDLIDYFGICKNYYSTRYAVDIVKTLLERGVPANTEAFADDEDYVYRYTPIHTAFQKQQELSIVKILLDLCKNINHKHYNGCCYEETLLQTVMSSSLSSSEKETEYYLKIFPLLIARGADISDLNKPCICGDTPLWAAVTKRKMLLIHFLRENGADFDVKKDGENLLYALAKKRYAYEFSDDDDEIALFNLLISKGCQVNTKDRFGRTPLHEAILCNNVLIIQKLIEHDADVNCRANDGTTALQVAVCTGNLSAVEILGNNGADFNAFDKNGNNLLHLLGQNSTNFLASSVEPIFNLLVGKGCEINGKNLDGETPLQLTVKHDNFTIVQKLIDHGAEVNSKTNNGMTPILKAVDNKYNLPIVDLLLKNGADPDLTTKNNENLLHLLVKDSELDATDDVLRAHVNLLISKNCQVNAKDKNGCTPLFLAAIVSCNVRILELLKENGADLSLTPKDDENLLHMFLKSTNYKNLIEKEQIKLFCLLINEDNPINEKDQNGNSLIHIAAAHATIPIVQVLVELGANVNCRNDKKETPLHLALKNNEVFVVVKFLLEHGANVNAKNSMGLTALHKIDTESGISEEILWILLTYGANVNAEDGQKQTVLHCAHLRDSLKYNESCYREANLRAYYHYNDGDDYYDDDDDYYDDDDDNEGHEGAEVVFFVKHSIKLMAAKLPWDKNINTCLRDFDKYNEFEYNHKEYYKECLKEIEKLKSTFIYGHISLYNLLHLNPSSRCAYIHNEKLLEIVKSSKLEEEFPECFILVLASYHEAMTKKSLIEPAKEAWLELTNIVLPDPCIECIFSFLNNSDIFDMIERE